MAEAHIDPAISRYIAVARAVPALSREEETGLARRFRDHGDMTAAEQLIRANLRFVVAIAVSYRRYGLRLADLVSEGNLGLMMAMRKFDPERGIRFVTYAAYWSRAYILNFVIKSWSMVGGGSGPLRSKLFFKLRRERAMVQNLVGEDDPSAMTMLAERMGTTVARAEALTNRLEARDVSLDMASSDEGRATLLDGLQDVSPSQEQRFFDEERRGLLSGALKEAVSNLDERERFIVETRLMSDEETSLAEIGRKLGVSRERARQLETRAKDKLKKQLAEFTDLLDVDQRASYAA
ncbi:MAG: RNA polymerase sigma factor RpoH [Polyangiales bacterium]